MLMMLINHSLHSNLSKLAPAVVGPIREIAIYFNSELVQCLAQSQ
jgi:hypothetical protein